MATIRTDGVAGKLSADLASGGTSMSSAGLADLAAVTGSDTAKITLFQQDTNGRIIKREVVYVTAHTAAATSATISRGQEGTTAQAWNGSSAPDSWVHAPTAADFGTSGSGLPLKVVSYNPATQVNNTTTSTTFAALDTTNLAATFTAPTSGQVIVKLAAVGQSSASSSMRWAIISAGSVIAGSQRWVTNTTSYLALNTSILITGLTAGSSYTFQWAQATDSTGVSVTTTYGGTTAGLGSVGQAVMEVWAA